MGLETGEVSLGSSTLSFVVQSSSISLSTVLSEGRSRLLLWLFENCEVIACLRGLTLLVLGPLIRRENS